MIDFLNKQVIFDCYFMTISEFSDFYQENFSIDKKACFIIWHGVREFVPNFNRTLVKSNKLNSSDFEKVKLEIYTNTINKDPSEGYLAIKTLDEKLPKLEKFIMLRMIGLSLKEASIILNIKDKSLKRFENAFRKMGKE